MPTLPPELAGLAALAHARRTAAEYYAPLLTSENEVLRIGAWCALLDREAIAPEQVEAVIALARYGAIQGRAFRYFESNWDHAQAARVDAMAASTEAEADRLARAAELGCNPAAAAEAQRQRFLATGRFETLAGLVSSLEQAHGWRGALPTAVDALVLYPHEPVAADVLLRLLYEARQKQLLKTLLGLLREASLHPYLVMLYDAAVRLLEGDAAGCRRQLVALDTARPPRPDILARIRPLALRLNAELLEKQGDYRAAYQAYADLNKVEQSALPGDTYYRAVLAAAAQNIPLLPPDGMTNHLTMTGFPRSGTTLLENALAAHPVIETFEEIPTVSSMQLHLDRCLPAASSEAEAVAVCLAARARYYDETLRRHRKQEASLFIDKMPMRSSEAALMLKMFPDKRYIFSIRHPFDVVLSCFKQQFSRNIATEQFATFENAVKLYDFSMSQWFAVHGLDDRRVHYLRYDDLVTSFERSMRGVLDFLGAAWDPAVLDFAERADNRFARTPSYQKVRQGLTIGVQSAWRNYGFLFQSAVARPLRKWADFFGYPAA
jgi:sulfotransferase family protein